MTKPEIFASKAVHQYRTRDVFAYLALRYYFESDAAKLDRWAEDNAAQIVLASPKGRYLPVLHLKDIKEDGKPEHRPLFVPSPSEALVEALIICECAQAWKSERSPRLFSYEAQDRQSPGAYFETYMPGLRRRQSAIGASCKSNPNALVRYIDIKRFYPSITPRIAGNAWTNFCERHDLPELIRTLGRKLIKNHAIETNDQSILTGPMFSHFLANLVLKDIDDAAPDLPAAYFRYVDDITLVGTEAQINESVQAISDRLGGIGFALHIGNAAKDFVVPATEWLASVSDFSDESGQESWRNLVGGIKQFLLLHAEQALELDDALKAQGFRFPLPDYSKAISERSAYQKVKRLGLWHWLFRKAARTSIDSIIADGARLAKRYEAEAYSLLGQVAGDGTFHRKRNVSKLRYRLGRLIYLADTESLSRLQLATNGIKELRFHSAIIRAVVTRDCSEVIDLGANVAQATAQIFRATGETSAFASPISTDAEMQGLAVFLLNGVSVEGEVRTDQNPLVKIAYRGIDRDLMMQPRGFVQELACLHGLGEPRHANVMKTAFDLDQDITLDALEFEYDYYM